MKKSDKGWTSKRFGYFVLLATRDGGGVQQVLGRYFGRTEIESVIKTSKEYLQLLPLRKWTDEAVRGKILSDIIATINS